MRTIGADSTSRVARHRDVLHLLVRHANHEVVDAARVESELQDIDVGDPAAGTDDEAESLARDLESMGPTFVKLGQVLSTRADLLPHSYLSALSRLQDDVTPVAPSEIRAVIEEELGMAVGDVFASFDDEPLAAASVAQVHRARLADGTDVAVKVQRPGILERVRRDLAVLDDLARLVDASTEVGRQFGFEDFVSTFRRSFVSELDFRHEADNLDAFQELLVDYPRLSVPRPIHRLVTRKVLTMTFVDGAQLSGLGPLAQHDIDGGELAEELVRAYLDQILVHGVVHVDPHPGNVLLHDDEITQQLDPAFDQEELMRGLEKMSTRMTAGIVLAAMLLAAALAMRIDTEVTLLGVPAVALVFFVLAGIGGLVLVGHVLLVDRRDRMRRRRRQDG